MDTEDKKNLINLLKPTQVILDIELRMPEKRHIGRIYDCHEQYFIVIIDDEIFELVKYDRVVSITIRMD